MNQYFKAGFEKVAIAQAPMVGGGTVKPPQVAKAPDVAQINKSVMKIGGPKVLGSAKSLPKTPMPKQMQVAGRAAGSALKSTQQLTAQSMPQSPFSKANFGATA